MFLPPKLKSSLYIGNPVFLILSICLKLKYDSESEK